MDWCEKAIVPAGHCSGPGGVAAFQRRGMASDPLSGSREGCAVLWLMLQDLGFPFDADEALEAEGSWGNHQHFPDDHGAITAVPDRNRASRPVRHARRFEPRFLSSAHARVPGQRFLQGPSFKLLEQNGKAVGQLTLHKRILVPQSLSNTTRSGRR
jgi:hypothetical protein